jgi:hypothetical protein
VKAIIGKVKFAITAAAAAITLAGCSNRNIDSIDAVKQGVIRDISKNINVAAMDVNVVSVSFRDREADAVVAFAPKGGTVAQGLTMSYTMERNGAEWHIKSRGAALQQHAAQAPSAMQQQSGAMNGSGQSQLPPGHPPANDGGSANPLPAGHPPLDTRKQ